MAARDRDALPFPLVYKALSLNGAKGGATKYVRRAADFCFSFSSAKANDMILTRSLTRSDSDLAIPS